jgi:hypothetical protein
MNYLDELKSNKEIFFKFMKEKFPIFFNSNIFLRDLLYAIRSYFERKEKSLSYSQAEKLALEFAEYLEKENEIKKVGKNTWKVNFFAKQVVNKVETIVN